ncbi:PulJ/GspJ family protein [Prosthecodimorpha staleyi]|uniref:Prepilin-type N-terminal cleavage/methylation domain-containing protein n=1 Tax=Prosthecodimorpha staleyi TaxID=2840188 RepID=A0A947GCW6_9HYPH|nr:hypothetical protein [Prosthecodimorpha staleyi]MBT9289626.1 hypothetical protein [Prosthecodimorpha staleyi]
MRPSSSSPARARQRPPATHGRAGFSLVEVLAAVVLTVGLIVAAMPFLTGVLGRWMTGQRSLEDADLWMRASLRLSEDTARAIPLVTGDPKSPTVAYRGDDRQIRFVRPSLSSNAASRFETVTITLERTDDGEAVIRRTSPWTPAGFDAPGGGGTATTILSGPYRFRFVQVSGSGDRSADWSNPQEMPRLVELVVEPTGRRPVPAAPLALPILANRPGGGPAGAAAAATTNQGNAANGTSGAGTPGQGSGGGGGPGPRPPYVQPPPPGTGMPPPSGGPMPPPL